MAISQLMFELVLPCYNESKSIKTIITKAAEAAVSAGFTPEMFQLVLVENGSKDNSGVIMDELKQTELGRWFRKVQIEVNQGYGFGLMSGLKSTTASFVAWSHADQQCDSYDAFRGLEIIKSDQCKKLLVKGVRTQRNWKDKIVSRTFEFMAWCILGMKVYEMNAQPKVFSRTLLEQIKAPPNGFAFDLYVLYCAAKSGYEFKTISVAFPPRVHGVSNWAAGFFSRYKTIFGMIRYMWDLARLEGRV
jgi:glycosyltransferase involved in cell wall biosynthesis